MNHRLDQTAMLRKRDIKVDICAFIRLHVRSERKIDAGETYSSISEALIERVSLRWGNKGHILIPG